MDLEPIYDADEGELAAVFEAAFCRLGQLGRDGGIAVQARIRASSDPDIEEGLVQLDELYEREP